MTGTDTTDHHDKKPATKPATPNASCLATEERSWIHNYLRSPVADKALPTNKPGSSGKTA